MMEIVIDYPNLSSLLPLWEKVVTEMTDFGAYLLDQSSDFLTSDDFKRSNEIVRTNWPIYSAIRHFVVMI